MGIEESKSGSVAGTGKERNCLMDSGNGSTRRSFVAQGIAAAMVSSSGFARGQSSSLMNRRPAFGARHFHSRAVDAFLTEAAPRIGDPVLRTMFVNCFPNTLDTTVIPGSFDGHPDTAVVTGDIAAMWLRDSSAQVWPYLRFAAQDEPLRQLLEGIIRRQTRCLLIDTYANAFMADLSKPPLPWSVHDKTEMKQGVGERKYELDSLCYPIRLAYGYWKATGNVLPFDAAWLQAMQLVLQTMRVQQRRHGEGPYRFQRQAFNPTDSLVNGIGYPANPVGMIASCFRPSDDACLLPFLVPSNLFAVTSLRQLAELSHAVHQDGLATEANALAKEVETALQQYALVPTPEGTIWAYEVDGFGGHILMDDANVPSLLALPYLHASPAAAGYAAVYARTRNFVWSHRNPWFFEGSAGEGIGGPHIGRDSIWPMSQIIFALTSQSEDEVRRMLRMLRDGSAGTGFIHESYKKNDAHQFTRAWFAWANTLFGELVAKTIRQSPQLLA